MNWLAQAYQWATGQTVGVGLNDVEPWKQYAKNAGYLPGYRTVTIEGALGLTVVFACVRLLVDSVAGLSVDTFERTPKGRKPATDHPVHQVLSVRPNDWMTPFQFKRAMMLDLVTHGNAFAEIDRRAGVLESLWPLRAAGMKLNIDDRGRPLNYEYDSGQGVRRIYAVDEIFHLRGFGWGLWGLSPIAYARMAIGGTMATQEWGAKGFQRGMKMSGYVTVDQELTTDQRKQFRKAIIEPIESGDEILGLLEKNMDIKTISLTPQDAQWIETNKWQAGELARLFGVPAPLVGELDRATWGNLEELGTQFVQYGIIPHTNEWQGAASMLFAPRERGNFYIKFNVNALMRGNSAARSAFYAVMIRNGIMTVNEVRSLEDMEDMPGGDELRAQAQMLPLDQAGQPEDQPAERRSNLRVVP